MSFFGGRSTQPATPTTQTSFVREAPGIEERKIELMDIARQVAQQPINLPAIQVSPLSGLEQQGITAAGTTGVGTGTVQQGIGQILGAAAPVICAIPCCTVGAPTPVVPAAVTPCCSKADKGDT